MKNKLFTVLLISFLFFSTLNLTSAEQVKCSQCNGSGKAVCPICDGTGRTSDAPCLVCDGTSLVPSNIVKTELTANVEGRETFVTATFENQETDEATATITASVGDHSVTSPEITFPSKEPVTLNLTIPAVAGYSPQQIMQSIKIQIDATTTVICKTCDGTGFSDAVNCVNCNGAGTIYCPNCKGSGYVEAGLLPASLSGLGPLIIGGVVIAVVAACLAVFVVLKKRRVSEKKLRKMSSGEFQRWVLKKMDGTPASSTDLSLGIDGFSRSNEPIAIKHSSPVGMAAIDSFAAALRQRKYVSGTIVAFEFSSDAIRSKIRARTTYRVNIDMLTVQDLLNRR